MSSLMEKYLKAQNKKNMTVTHEVWDTMSCVDLAKVLDADADDVFELILNIDENLLNDERQPIRNRCSESMSRLGVIISKSLTCHWKINVT